ncbi:hypothetical protein N0V90_012911 [Kalmusia sp. IMI 367209]|nr:hypothetical protein N0V90_012911 [Kalmusia sp. IMI 367209]
MCHWVLRIVSKASVKRVSSLIDSCDRAIHDPYRLLTPLHPSVVPIEVDEVTAQANETLVRLSAGPQTTGSGKPKDKLNPTVEASANNTNRPTTYDNGGATTPSLAAVSPTEALLSRSPTVSTCENGSKTVYVRDANTGTTIPIPLFEVGKASRFGDRKLTAPAKCNVFEVVLQRNERTICPTCARSPRRASLPAYARGCFAPS